ncbi:hypothetical protein [Hydrogenovibrio sp. JE_KL2]|uniref:hypothetical protein n=1 Tax=Hydrogenovibrio sp. JE_KL2 TaxID=2651188 RepID=UPI00128B724B|nr:hypothetical protein [Hydrogenovibrio sp. JE_KL2]MPQ76799.1 hypothetical protein [Hydrogenovibrio sp. JE_KL2]
MKPEQTPFTDAHIDAILQDRKLPNVSESFSKRIIEKAETVPQSEPTWLTIWSEITFIWQSCFSLSPAKIALPVFVVGILIGGLGAQDTTPQTISSYFNQAYQYGYTP